MKRELLLIFNPSSGRQLVNHSLSDIILSLQEKWEVTVKPTSYAGQAEAIAASIGENYEVVVAAGGDGTIHEVVNGLMKIENRPILGILPGGTANDIARSLQIPLNLLQSCEFLKNEGVQHIEVGQCGDRHFINFLGFGLISLVSNQVKSETKALFGHFTYYLKSLQFLHNKESFRVKIETDKETVDSEAVMGYIANGRSLGGIELFPYNGLGDGQFEVFLVHDVKLSELVNVASSYLQHAPFIDEAITHFKATSLTIECEPAQLIDMDGEKSATTPVQIKLIPKALRVIGRL